MLELDFAISQHFLDDRGQRAGFILLGSFLAASSSFERALA